MKKYKILNDKKGWIKMFFTIINFIQYYYFLFSNNTRLYCNTWDCYNIYIDLKYIFSREFKKKYILNKKLKYHNTSIIINEYLNNLVLKLVNLEESFIYDNYNDFKDINFDIYKKRDIYFNIEMLCNISFLQNDILPDERDDIYKFILYLEEDTRDEYEIIDYILTYLNK